MLEVIQIKQWIEEAGKSLADMAELTIIPVSLTDEALETQVVITFVDGREIYQSVFWKRVRHDIPPGKRFNSH